MASREVVLELLRKQLAVHRLAAYIIPTSDPHNSEYVPACFQRRDFISGFTGSAGTAVVTPTEALLWTDARYFLQAEQELSSSWTLMKMLEPKVPTLVEWLAQLPTKSRIGVDPQVITVGFHAKLKKEIESSATTPEIVPIDENLVDAVWTDRPPLTSNRIFTHPVKYSGKSLGEKLDEVAKKIAEKKADWAVYTALDDIAWLFNLRGSDVSFNPVFLSYALVSSDGRAHLFANSAGFDPNVRGHLGDRVTVHDYTRALEIIPTVVGGGAVLYDEHNTNYGIFAKLQARGKVCAQQSFPHVMKAAKNEVEMQGMVSCHVRDGLALSRYLKWLEEELAKGTALDECTAADKLESFRREMDLFEGLSFDSISSSGPNGAIIHYRPEPKTARAITTKEMYLIDSGGQYKDGTTDVTRTLHFGTPTAAEIEAYTLVLKGNIGLSRAVWPDGCHGSRLDSFARQALWRLGLDYGHGTGHGVGSFLNVHEGPIGISVAQPPYSKPIPVNAVLSNEPGFYQPGQFGVRIENLEAVVKVDTKYQFNKKQYLGFKTLTMVPLDQKLIDTSLLTEEECDWVDDYHSKVVTALLGLDASDKGFNEWLREKCKPLVRGSKTSPPAKKRKLQE